MPLILNGTTGISGVDGSAGTPSYVGVDTDTGVLFPAANTLALSTGGTERVRVDSSGNVGIGTSSPTRPLHVFTTGFGVANFIASGGETNVVIQNTGTNGRNWSLIAGGNGGAFSSGQFGIYDNTAAAARLAIDSSGNVGIGTTSPVFGSGSGVEVYRAGIATYRLSSSGAGVEFRNNSGTGELDVRGAFPMVFSTNATERMRITSGGNVGIGTSSPASLLDVTGNDPTIRLTDNAGSPASTWSIRSTDGNFAIRDVTNSYDRATFNANGCMALTGANLTATGIGITFPATQSASSDANTLDDYEEGTWTPVDASGAGLVFSASGGRYVKIGRMVYFAFRAQYPSTSNTSQAQIGGLPYTSISSSAGSYDMGGFATQGLSQNYSQSYMAGIPPNSAQMDRVMNLQSSSSVALNNASLSNQNIYLWGWYYANA